MSAEKIERRPGRFIKDYLLEHGEASITDIHWHYKEGIKNINAGRERGNRIRTTTYPSFYKYFRHLETLGLVERVGEEPTTDVEKTNEMGFIERVDGDLTVHEGAVKRLWRLTGKGMGEVLAWDDPLKAMGYYPRPYIKPY